MEPERMMADEAVERKVATGKQYCPRRHKARHGQNEAGGRVLKFWAEGLIEMRGAS